MGLAYEIIAARIANPGAAGAAAAAVPGDSLNVKAVPFDNAVFLEQVWHIGGTAGFVRITSPRMHDQAQGLRLQGLANTPVPLLPEEAFQPLYSQDALSVTIAGGATETDIAYLAMYYRDIPGMSARLVSWADIAGRIRNLIGVQVAVAGAAAIGDWGPGDAITSDFDQLKANVDYAVLGYETTVAVGAVGLRGPDTGNARVGGPGTTERQETRDWFVRQSRATGLPHIPVINAANKATTLVDINDDAAATACTVSFVLAELGAV